jgi:Holliday junction resolvase RusA-like endonuclease
MKESWYYAEINPVPWTVPSISIRRSKNGKPYPQLYSSETLVTYKKALYGEIKKDYKLDEPTKSPVRLEFYFSRKIESFNTKGRKRNSNYADATNLQKAAEDALQGLLFVNDSQVTQVSSTVVAQDPDALPWVVVKLTIDPHYLCPPESITSKLGKGLDLKRQEEDNKLDTDVKAIF